MFGSMGSKWRFEERPNLKFIKPIFSEKPSGAGANSCFMSVELHEDTGGEVPEVYSVGFKLSVYSYKSNEMTDDIREMNASKKIDYDLQTKVYKLVMAEKKRQDGVEGATSDQILFNEPLREPFLIDAEQLKDGGSASDLKNELEDTCAHLYDKWFVSRSDLIVDKFSVFLIVPYQGDLHDMLDKGDEPIELDTIVNNSFQLIFSTLQMSARYNMLHRDLKPGNVMTDLKANRKDVVLHDPLISDKKWTLRFGSGRENPILKIGDFDTVVFHDTTTKKETVHVSSIHRGTLGYIACESFLNFVSSNESGNKAYYNSLLKPFRNPKLYGPYRALKSDADLYSIGVIVGWMLMKGTTIEDKTGKIIKTYKPVRKLEELMSLNIGRVANSIIYHLRDAIKRNYPTGSIRLTQKFMGEYIKFGMHQRFAKLILRNTFYGMKPLKLADIPNYAPMIWMWEIFTIEKSPSFWDTVRDEYVIIPRFTTFASVYAKVKYGKELGSQLLEVVQTLMAWNPKKRRNAINLTLFSALLAPPSTITIVDKKYNPPSPVFMITSPTSISSDAGLDFKMDFERPLPKGSKSIIELTITVEKKAEEHSYFGKGSEYCYAINGKQMKSVTVFVGRRYRFIVNSRGHPARFSTNIKGGPKDDGVIQGKNDMKFPQSWPSVGVGKGVLVHDISEKAPTDINLVCSLHKYMGMRFRIV